MRLTESFSPAALEALVRRVPFEQCIAAWKAAYDTYIHRASTCDGHGHAFAESRANRFWPLYLK